jgi:menaquinone-specific isochorismate synthase
MESAATKMAAELTRLLSAAPEQDAAGPGITRIEIDIPERNPLAWLETREHITRYYWAERDEKFEMAGIGECDVLAPSGSAGLAGLFRQMRGQLSARWPYLRYYGGFRFHRGAVKGDRWRAFREFRFVVPAIEVVRSGDSTLFAANIKIRHPRTNRHTLEKMMGLLETAGTPGKTPPADLPRPVSRRDLPDRAGWTRMVDDTLGAIAAGDLEKAVLARECCFTFDGAPDPVTLLRRLLTRTKRSFEFCFHPADDRAFIGASPERLFRRNNCFLESEALAGTVPRGATDELDRGLAEKLRNNTKDRTEHAFVADMLEKQFARFCGAYRREEKPRIMKLRNCQHLYTRFEGILADADADAALIEALHPTPAVGGTPRDAALAWIAAQEPFDRGIFASPVGWTGWDAAQFCVAIRSALVRDNELAVYTGAGIVRDSDPAGEWEELETKMRNFLHTIDEYGSF